MGFDVTVAHAQPQVVGELEQLAWLVRAGVSSANVSISSANVSSANVSSANVSSANVSKAVVSRAMVRSHGKEPW